MYMFMSVESSGKGRISFSSFMSALLSMVSGRVDNGKTLYQLGIVASRLECDEMCAVANLANSVSVIYPIVAIEGRENMFVEHCNTVNVWYNIVAKHRHCRRTMWYGACINLLFEIVLVYSLKL